MEIHIKSTLKQFQHFSKSDEVKKLKDENIYNVFVIS